MDKAVNSIDMTLRDYFAAAAMQGMLNGSLGRFDDGTPSAYRRGGCNNVVANRAYVIADAMLTERISHEQ